MRKDGEFTFVTSSNDFGLHEITRLDHHRSGHIPACRLGFLLSEHIPACRLDWLRIGLNLMINMNLRTDTMMQNYVKLRINLEALTDRS